VIEYYSYTKEEGSAKTFAVEILEFQTELGMLYCLKTQPPSLHLLHPPPTSPGIAGGTERTFMSTS